MSMKPTDRILAPPRGSAAEAMAYARKRGASHEGHLALYFATVYDIAPKIGMDPSVVVVQSALETFDWTDAWWTERLNPAGIGITGDPQQNDASKVWATGEESALAQMVHLWLYAKGWPLPPALAPYAHLDPRRDAIHVSNLGSCETLEDLGGKWAVVLDYGQRIANRSRSVFPTLPDQVAAEEPTAMGYTKHDWSGIGFPGGLVYLPDDIPVEIKIIPSTVWGWTSGTKGTGQTRTTWHDTGNTTSSASGEYAWARDGGRGRLGSPGSYNGIFDKDRIIITQRFDEIVGHSATPQGNRQSWAFEQAFGTGFDAGLRVGAALHGGICAAMGWQVDTALVKHQDWSGKWCPGQILNRSLWSHVVKLTSQAAVAALGAAAGGGVVVPPTYPAPAFIPELEAFKTKPNNEIPYRVNGDGWVAIYVGDRVGAHRETRRRRFAVGTEDVGPLIKPGEQFDVDWLIISGDFADTYYTPYGTRVLAEDTGRISDMKGTGE
jgi:hypothetical protein